MPQLRRPLLSLLIVLLAGSVSAAVVAGERGDEDKDRQKKQESRDDRDDADSLSESVRRIERATQGEILSAERVQFDGRDVNRVKVVDDRGRVRVYVDDPEKTAQSGDRTQDDKPTRRTRRDDSDDPNL